MNPRTTISLVLAASGLFAYIFFFEWRRPVQPAAGASKLFPNLDPTKVVSIELFRSNTVIRAERTNDHWRLTLPGQPPYPAQVTAIENCLTLLAALNRRAYIAAHELPSQPDGLAAFGLENPPVAVT